VDLENPNTVEKAEIAQRLLQHSVTTSRNVLCAYGVGHLEQSPTLKVYFDHPLTQPLWIDNAGTWMRRLQTQTRGSSKARSDAEAEAEEQRNKDAYLIGDMSEQTPMQLRHEHAIRNLKLTRRKVAEFLDDLLQKKNRIGSQYQNTPLVECMMIQLAEAYPEEEEALEFACNIYAATRRYSAEPDFFGYLMLLLDKMPESLIRDNKRVAAELLKVLPDHLAPLADEPEPHPVVTKVDGKLQVEMPKAKFEQVLANVFPNKEDHQLQELFKLTPRVDCTSQQNLDWLLYDDMYTLSPFVYGLRIQHYEEVLGLLTWMEETVRGAVGPSCTKVRYGATKQLFENSSLCCLTKEDNARAFGVGLSELTDDTEQDINTFFAMMKTSDIFHDLFFPSRASPGDEFDNGTL